MKRPMDIPAIVSGAMKEKRAFELGRPVQTFLRGWLLLALCWSSSVLQADDYQGATHMMPFEEDTIRYNKTEARGPVQRLQERIDQGKVNLEFHPQFGYLLAVLRELGVSTQSQMLVFSKTSFQRERISPHAPRAVFYSDDAYVGYVLGSPLLEFTSVDPKLGGVFYTLEQNPKVKPKFVRTDACVECHASGKTMGVPGHLVRSFETDESGVVDLTSGTSLVNHRTPFQDRWGGWYVTGSHGPQLHRGNLIGKEAFERQRKEPNYLGNLTDLSKFFDLKSYPTPHSDIVALMVMEHQSHMHNFLTRLQYEATIALQMYGHVNYLKTASEGFLRYLLFTEEASLTAQVRGSSEFAQTFSAQGIKDRQGRSLREFDLQTRLFKYPCSYLIYSAAFDELPEKLKERLYRRLWEVLTERDSSPEFAMLSSEKKRAIFEILVDTKKGLPEYWKTEQKRASL
jgi:hypothetical protein